VEFKPDIEETVARCRALWGFEELGPPFVMIQAPEAPIASGAHDCAFWQDPDGFVAHHERVLERRLRIRDDTVPVLRPPLSHAAAPGALGAPVEMHGGHLWARPVLRELEEHEALSLNAAGEWVRRLEAYYRRLLALAAGRFFVGPCEVPGPADLMGALRGHQQVLLDLCDSPEAVERFAVHVARLARSFDEMVRGWLASQEGFDGCWMASAWAPPGTLQFCEHSSVNYSPEQYDRFLSPSNAELMRPYRRVVSYVYCSAGRHLAERYFQRGRPIWVRSCDGNPPAQMVERHRGDAIVTIHTTAPEFPRARARFGSRGVCYFVECASLEEAVALGDGR